MSRERLEDLYETYNQRKYVHPDPLEFLYDYNEPLEMEIVGLVASSLAYGRVAQILKSVSSILERMGPSPRSFLAESSRVRIFSAFSGFRHRFTTGEEMACMLLGAKRVIEKHGSLYKGFMESFDDSDDTVLPALSSFMCKLDCVTPGARNSLMPSPERGSACKRWNLFLRWMVRKDSVDPGGWQALSPSKLIIPLDTHMHNICLKLGITRRKQADMRTAIDITRAFGRISPDDPVRYDFSLTRLGIRKDTDLEEFLRQCRLSV